MDIPASMQPNAAMFAAASVASAPSPLPLYGSGSLSSSHTHHHFVRYRHSCEHCRKRKIKCSGTRPVCDHCQRRSIPCIYKPLARTRRTPSLAGSPAFSGVPGAQPIPIPAAGHQGLSPGYPTPTDSLSPAALRYSSAPAGPLGFAHVLADGMAGQQQGQGKMLRPANAIPPYLLAPAAAAAAAVGPSPECSPFAFAPPVFSPFPSPADCAAGQLPQQAGSFSSVHSDLSDILGQHAQQQQQQQQQQQPPGSLYDLQPGGLGAYASPKTASFFNQDGSLSLLSFAPPQPGAGGRQDALWQPEGPADGALGGQGRHRRTLTGGSADSLSNVPLVERAEAEAGGAQDQWMLEQLGFAQLPPQPMQPPQQMQPMQPQGGQRAAGGIAPGLTVLDQPPVGHAPESQTSAPPTG